MTFEETTILRCLALQHRQGPPADFAGMLQQEIGASAEAVIGPGRDQDRAEVRTALVPQGRSVLIGIVQKGSTALLRNSLWG